MKIAIEELLAWVDGELDEPRAGEVSKAVSSDKHLQQHVEQLRASKLPYQEAYQQASLPDVPESLRVKIQDLQNAVAQNSAADLSDIQHAEDQNQEIQTLNVQTKNADANNGSYKMIGIAASVMLAVLIGFLGGANRSAPITPIAKNNVSASLNVPAPMDDFAQTVAEYQKFYTRETLLGTVAPNPAKVTERLANQTDMQVLIPKLEGYEFRRAQRLSINGELLLQLVYLGDEGGPLALCYVVAPSGDAGSGQGDETAVTTIQQHHGLNTAEWRHSGHRFVIVSDASEKTLDKLSQSTRRQWDS